MGKVKDFFRDHVNMTDDIDHGQASLSIRNNIAFKGPNVFILACAIIIASVGLNVNSIPVIIGAMLISPVMGPILGFGFGLSVQDFRLVKDSFENFGIMVGISIVASTLFFVLSPLTLENPSELLARTNPTIYDVLVALFGGIAGMLETCRKEKGTVISGVAIATALMPPLCTVGYGLSILNWSYVIGALYLFLINSIFIALATLLTARYLKFPVVNEINLDGKHQRLSRRAFIALMLIIIVPSIFSATAMIRENNFKIHAERVISRNKTLGKGFIYDYKVNTSSRPNTIELYMAGESLTAEQRELLFRDAEEYGITRSQIVFHEDATMSRDIMSESELIKSIYEHNDQQVKALEDSIAKLENRLTIYRNRELPVEEVSKELFAQYPFITEFSLANGPTVKSSGEGGQEQVVAVISASEPIDNEMLNRIQRWLAARFKNDNVRVILK